MRARAVGRRFALGILAAAAAGCKIDVATAPASAPTLVVFGVLNLSGASQPVLLMQSRASAPSLTAAVSSNADPIVALGETPVTGATVVVSDAAGDSAVLVEDRVRRADHLGSGVYRLFTRPGAGVPAGDYLPLVAGQVYRLRVHSALGDAEGTARVPSTSPALVTAGPPYPITLGRDSVVLPAITVLSGAGFIYSLRTPDGTLEANAEYRRTLERRLILPSGDGWAFAYAADVLEAYRDHVLTVTAADSSYFAYYSADTDPFADRSARTTLRGASGVFGAVSTVAAVPVSVAGGAPGRLTAPSAASAAYSWESRPGRRSASRWPGR